MVENFLQKIFFFFFFELQKVLDKRVSNHVEKKKEKGNATYEAYALV